MWPGRSSQAGSFNSIVDHHLRFQKTVTQIKNPPFNSIVDHLQCAEKEQQSLACAFNSIVDHLLVFSALLASPAACFQFYSRSSEAQVSQPDAVERPFNSIVDHLGSE